MNKEQKDEAKESGLHVLHGLEDVIDVAAHGAAGAVKGVADGVESASAATKTRNSDSPSHSCGISVNVSRAPKQLLELPKNDGYPLLFMRL